MNKTRIKFCGITNLDDALAAVHLGVDALGFIFHANSPRNISIPLAAAIVQQLPPFVTSVGVVVNEPAEHIQAILSQVPLDIIQFHGKENDEFCRSFGKPYIKVMHIGEKKMSGIELERSYPDARAFLLDTEKKGLPGGSGLTFNWNNIPNLHKPVILAGGLTIENIQQALTRVRPFAVDVTSGIEKSRGLKDHMKMRQFISLVQAFAN